jgi:hypothetical protein
MNWQNFYNFQTQSNMYTGHSFRRRSSTLLMANAPGVDMLDLKRHGSWRSSSVAEGQAADKILHENSGHMMQKTRTIQKTGVISVTLA